MKKKIIVILLLLLMTLVLCGHRGCRRHRHPHWFVSAPSQSLAEFAQQLFRTS
ncbi:MAG: hypothetical protein GY849_05295 [Deltaproteobacteria bacterium]|nr:hypothetical protein [Deltaproteobacteria bacterium]